MKAWITKVALGKKGIFEVDGTRTTYGLKYKDPNYVYGGYAMGIEPGRQWHTTRESALKRAEEMRVKRIATITKELKRLEALRFA